MQFLLDSLADLDEQLRVHGGQLYLFRGDPAKIFERLHDEMSIISICFEQDCEPIWVPRDKSVENVCNNRGIKFIEKVSHTLWDPSLVINANGGIPPLTYEMFLHIVQIMGPPSRPVGDPDWSNVKFVSISENLKKEFNIFDRIPTPEDFNIYPESLQYLAQVKWLGGEKQALMKLQSRLNVEENAFKKGCYLPNQANPDILGPPMSISAHLRFGCLSVRQFYWAVHDLYQDIQNDCNYCLPDGLHITSQLIWREYFYTMSVNNPNYSRMEGNDICLNIPWNIPSENDIEKWKYGRTGFPLVDAAMRQLLAEGWLHHILRNAVATFLTRGALWISWELGLQHFLKYLIDADWSVCAGNWMWVSSSAFEKLLDSSKCTCPIALAYRLDPNGEYIRRYVPELAVLPKQFIHEPWNTPVDVQQEVGCVIGVHYPERMIDLNLAAKRNNLAMKKLRHTLFCKLDAGGEPPHCRPSNDEEIRIFFWLND